MTENSEEKFIWVRRQWNSWRKAKYRLSDVQNVRWDTFSGGVYAPTPQPFLHGYVWCDGYLEGELDHSCGHGDYPHNIKVCIVKKDNNPAIFKLLVEQAGPKPKRN